MVRGRGYVRSTADLAAIVLKADSSSGTAVKLGDVARVELGSVDGDLGATATGCG